MADVAMSEGLDDGPVEIRIVLDQVEPPGGRLRIASDPRQAHGPLNDVEIGFTGWLGLLKALYEVTGAEVPGAGDGR